MGARSQINFHSRTFTCLFRLGWWHLSAISGFRAARSALHLHTVLHRISGGDGVSSKGKFFLNVTCAVGKKTDCDVLS